MNLATPATNTNDQALLKALEEELIRAYEHQEEQLWDVDFRPAEMQRTRVKKPRREQIDSGVDVQNLHEQRAVALDAVYKTLEQRRQQRMMSGPISHREARETEPSADEKKNKRPFLGFLRGLASSATDIVKMK